MARLNIGSRAQVMHGTAKQTAGGLTKKQLKYNKRGRIVSRKASRLAKKNNRLVKAGYITKKGQFGVVKRGGASNGAAAPREYSRERKIFQVLLNRTPLPLRKNLFMDLLNYIAHKRSALFMNRELKKYIDRFSISNSNSSWFDIINNIFCPELVYIIDKSKSQTDPQYKNEATVSNIYSIVSPRNNLPSYMLAENITKGNTPFPIKNGNVKIYIKLRRSREPKESNRSASFNKVLSPTL